MWCVVQTETRRELTASAYLMRSGYQTYVPKLEIVRAGEKRIEPLFPGYIFAQTDLTNWTPIRRSIAVIRIVMDGIKPAELPESEVLRLRKREGPRGVIEAKPWVRGRTRLVVMRGGFSGFDGIFQGYSGAKRVQILLQGLSRVSVPLRNVEPLRLASG